MTPREAGDLIKRVLGAFPAQRMKMSPADIDGMTLSYIDGLIDLEYAPALAALIRLNRTAEFFVTIAAIRREVLGITAGAQRNGVDAWGDVLKLRQYRDLDQLARFDPLVIQICRNLGWFRLRTTWRGGAEVEQWAAFPELENEASDRARFIESYDKNTTFARREAQVLPGAPAPELPGAASAARQLIGQVATKLSAKPEAALPCTKCGCVLAKHSVQNGACMCGRCEGFL